MAISLNAKKTTKKNSMSINLILGIIVLAGIFAWSRELSGVQGATDLSDYAPWGLYIACFLFFEAMCAGILFTTAIGIIVGNIVSRIKMAVGGVIAGVCAGLAILPDLGSPMVAWHLLFTPNLKSPMILDVWFLGLTIVVGSVVAWAIISKNEKIAKSWSYALAVVSVLLPIGTAWMFTTYPGKTGWASSLEIAVFLVQAVVLGASIWYLFNQNNQARTILFGALIANLVLTLGESGHALYNSGIETLAMKAMMTGSYSALFWLQILVGIALPIVLLWGSKAVNVVAGISIAGVLVSKYLFVVKGNIFPLLHAGEGMQVPSLFAEFKGYQMAATYVPTWEEWLVMLGVIAFGVLLRNIAFAKLRD